MFRFLKTSFLILLALYSSNGVLLDCVYSDRIVGVIGNLYTCTAGILPSDGGRNVSDVTHRHLVGRDNDDVQALFIDESIAFTPRNIHSFFPNLVAFTIYNKNTAELTRESLKGLNDLRLFEFSYNSLRIVEPDLFIENPKIEWIHFGNNPIRHVGFNVFDNLQNLKSLYLDNTACIDELAINPVDLDILKFRILVNCPPTFEMLETKLVSGSILQNIITAHIEDEIDPIRDLLHEIEAEQISLLARVEILEENSNGTRYQF